VKTLYDKYDICPNNNCPNESFLEKKINRVYVIVLLGSMARENAMSVCSID